MADARLGAARRETASPYNVLAEFPPWMPSRIRTDWETAR